MRAPWLWLAVGVGCAGPAARPVPDATLVVLGRDAATLAWDEEGDGLTATWVHPFLGGDVVVTERFLHDGDGALISWSRVREDGTGRWLEVGEDGEARWRLTEGGVDREGTWVLPERPRTWASPLPAPGAWTWWDGERVLPFEVLSEEDGVRVEGADGRSWRLSGPPTARRARFPDGSLLEPVVRRVPAYDPVQTVTLQGPWHVDPRRARQLDAVAGLTPITQRRPTAPELPRVPTVGPPPDEPGWTLPTAPEPVDLRVASSTDRLVTVSRAMAAVHALAREQGDPGVPDAIRTLARGGDCDDLATLLVAGLAHEGVPAALVRGWLLSEDGRWVRHAWVRVPMAPPTPWLDVDPALGQLPADVARLADDVLPPDVRPDQLTGLVIR